MAVEITFDPALQITVEIVESPLEAVLEEYNIEIATSGLQGPQGVQGNTTYTGLVGGNPPDFLFSPESYIAGGTTP